MNSIVTWVVFFIMSSSNALATNKSTSGEVPQLPPPDPEADLPVIRLGETISFEQFGPIILNTDGSTRRIANWDNLSEHEQKVSWRRISKRNEDRRQLLLKQQQEAAKTENQNDENKAEEL